MINCQIVCYRLTMTRKVIRWKMWWARNQDLLPPALSSLDKTVNRQIWSLDVMELAESETPGSKPTLSLNPYVFLSRLYNFY